MCILIPEFLISFLFVRILHFLSNLVVDGNILCWGDMVGNMSRGEYGFGQIVCHKLVQPCIALNGVISLEYGAIIFVFGDLIDEYFFVLFWS